MFDIPVTGRQTVYFQAFDENTNALNQKINKKFTVSTSKRTISEYPTQKQNGFVSEDLRNAFSTKKPLCQWHKGFWFCRSARTGASGTREFRGG